MECSTSNLAPVALARSWVVRYNRFVFSVVALREVARKGWQPGCLQDLVTDAAVAAVDAADQLRALGYSSVGRFSGDEVALWRRTVQYVCAMPWRTPPAQAPLGLVIEDAERVRAGWQRFVDFVWGLSDDCFAEIASLQPCAFRPDGLTVLLGEGCREAGGQQPRGEPGREGTDQPLVRFTGE